MVIVICRLHVFVVAGQFPLRLTLIFLRLSVMFSMSQEHGTVVACIRLYSCVCPHLKLL